MPSVKGEVGTTIHQKLIPKIKQDLFPKEVGPKSNKNQSKRSLDIHKDEVLLRVLQGRPSEKYESKDTKMYHHR